jgi:hypothetical protein
MDNLLLRFLSESGEGRARALSQAQVYFDRLSAFLSSNPQVS